MPLIDEVPKGGETKKEGELLSFVRSMLRDGVQDRARFDRDWEENQQFFQDKHWDQEGTPGRTRPVINYCKKVVRSTTPQIVDRRPSFDVMPVNPEHYELADVINAGAQWILYNQRFQRKLSKEAVGVQVIGDGFFEPVYDPDLDRQRGGIAIRPVTPWNVLALGGEDIQECEMVAVRRRMPIARLRRLYPNRGEAVEPEVDASNASVRPRLSQGGTFGRAAVTISTGGRADTYIPRQDQGGAYAQEYQEAAWLWEIYFKDEESVKIIEEMMEEESEIGEIFGEEREVLRYPNGWRMITVAGNTILSDIPLPYKHAMVPLVKISNSDIPGEFWSEGDIKVVKMLNRLVNLLVGQITDNLRLGNNPPLLVPAGSGININNWLNWPGIVAQFNAAGGAPHWMKPLEINPAAFKVVEMVVAYIFDMSGISEVSEGGLIKGASGELYAQMRESAMTRIRLKVDLLEDGLTQLGQHVVGLMQQFWTGHRMLRVSGLVPEERLARLPNIQRGPSGLAYLPINARTGEVYGGKPIRLNDVRQGQFEVKLVPGSTLSESRRQKLADILALKREGIYSVEDAVIALDDPRKDAILERIRMEQQVAQQQMQAAASSAPAKGPPAFPQPQVAQPEMPMPTEDFGGAKQRI